MYNPLAQFYEEIFPVSESQIHFIESTIMEKRESGGFTSSGISQGHRLLQQPQPWPRLLEVGCAVGDLAAAIADRGVEVDAIDLNPSMIQRAQSRHGRHTKDSLLRFHEMNMLDIDTKFEPASFDTAACLGNTLVHLPGPHEIERFLQAAARILRTSDISRSDGAVSKRAPRGTIILQILNYDYLLKQRPETLPPTENEKLRFERRYSYPAAAGKHITFSTRLLIKGSNTVHEDSVRLYPLRQAELELMLQRAGFKQPRFYGDFDSSPLQPDSFPLIAVASL